MPVVDIEPTKKHPVPYDTTDDPPSADFDEELLICATTAKVQQAMGAEVPEEEVEDIIRKDLLRQAVERKNKTALRAPAMALAAADFLREYSTQLALDVNATRSAITHKLMELANCGDPKYELKALELLGKHSDIGLFTERSEVTINYKDPAALEDAIKERVKRLLNADLIDITPTMIDVDEELGGPGEPSLSTKLVDSLDKEDEEEEEEEEEAGLVDG
jgi:hypothetical protein